MAYIVGMTALEAMLPVEEGPEMSPAPPERVATPSLNLESGAISVRPTWNWLPSKRIIAAGLKNMLLMSVPPALMPA